MSFGENKLSNPYEIEEAREAQHMASEGQRKLADTLAAAHKALAQAEFRYRRALSERMKQLHVDGLKGDGGGLAITTCEVVAKGEEPIALLRRERDELRGDVERLNQLAFTYGADRRGLDELVVWSRGRDLRVDAPPADWSEQETHGTGRPKLAA